MDHARNRTEGAVGLPPQCNASEIVCLRFYALSVGIQCRLPSSPPPYGSTKNQPRTLEEYAVTDWRGLLSPHQVLGVVGEGMRDWGRLAGHSGESVPLRSATVLRVERGVRYAHWNVNCVNDPCGPFQTDTSPPPSPLVKGPPLYRIQPACVPYSFSV